MARRENAQQLLEDLPGLSAPAKRALAGAGYRRLEQLTKVMEADLLALHGFGPSGIKTLRAALKAKGLAFAKQ